MEEKKFVLKVTFDNNQEQLAERFKELYDELGIPCSLDKVKIDW